jgi:hypothetical protein
MKSEIFTCPALTLSGNGSSSHKWRRVESMTAVCCMACMLPAWGRGIGLSTVGMGAKNKKPVTNQRFVTGLPLGHIGTIVMWEGNYRSNIYNIGKNPENFNKKSRYSTKLPG